MKFIFFILFLFFFSPIQAQLDALIKNDSITWIAEWDSDYIIDDFDLADLTQNNAISLIKYLNKETFGYGENKHFLTNCLWDAINANKITVFLDSDFNKIIKNKGALYREESRKRVNGEFEIDPIVYDTRFDDIPHPLSVDRVKQYRIHQLAYYNAVKAQFQLVCLAAAPLIAVDFDTSNQKEILEPLFWFKPEMHEANISSDDIIWAQTVNTRKNSIDLSKAKILKNLMLDTLFVHFMQCFEQRQDIPFWNYNGNSLKKMDMNERKVLLEEKYEPKDIKSIGLYQEWYWDERQSKLLIHLKGVAPRVRVYDEADNFLYDKSLFFRKIDD